jgi:phosphoglycolate phosphatase
MQQPKVVVFDCDGVMFDSRQANDAYYNHILAYFGKPPMSAEESRYVHMNTARASVAYLFRNDRRFQKAEAYRRGLSYLPFISKMKVEPYLKSFLAYLKPAYRTAIATNRSDTMNQVLEEHGLQKNFDLVVTSLDVKRPKPAPDPLLKILGHFGVTPLDAVYIGDSEIDERTAKAAGVPLVAYKNRTLSADYYVEGFSEMEALLEKGRRSHPLPV